MRLGLIGPSGGDTRVLRERAEFVLAELNVDRAVYLGADGALDDLVSEWASEIVQGDPSDDAVWTRAAHACAQAPADEIDQFLQAERLRQRLKLLECLPDSQARSVELFETIVAVLIYDKANLDEEDMLPASILVFGRSREPVVHKVGARSFVSPGPANHVEGGVGLLADDEHGVTLSIYGPDGNCMKQEVVAQATTRTHLMVKGGESQ